MTTNCFDVVSLFDSEDKTKQKKKLRSKANQLKGAAVCVYFVCVFCVCTLCVCVCDKWKMVLLRPKA